jgi:hypothetical protein
VKTPFMEIGLQFSYMCDALSVIIVVYRFLCHDRVRRPQSFEVRRKGSPEVRFYDFFSQGGLIFVESGMDSKSREAGRLLFRVVLAPHACALRTWNPKATPTSPVQFQSASGFGRI